MSNQSYAGNTQLCSTTHIPSLLVRPRHRSHQRQIALATSSTLCPFHFKYAMLVYRALNGIAPSYISRFCVKQPVVERRYGLRFAAPSQHDLVAPATKTQFGGRFFTVAGPSVWNTLPDFVKDAESLDIFKARLKMLFFRESFGV